MEDIFPKQKLSNYFFCQKYWGSPYDSSVTLKPQNYFLTIKDVQKNQQLPSTWDCFTNKNRDVLVPTKNYSEDKIKQ